MPLAPTTDPDEDPTKPVPARDGGTPTCTADPTRWLVPTTGGASERSLPYDSVAAVVAREGLWVVWSDHGTSSLVVQPPTGEAVRMPLGEGETQPPALALSGESLIVVLPTRRGATLVHRLLRAHAGGITELFSQPEAAGGDLDAAIVPLGEGVLVVWTDPTPAGASVVMGQFVPTASLQGGPVPPPAPRVLSPLEQDAADPVLIPRSDGTAVLAWLSAHEVEDVIANATTADVVVRVITANGQTSSPPVQVSPGPGNRFGVSGASSGDTTWIAYRVAGDADQESQGDGGSVAILRLGPDLHPTTSPAYVTSREGSPSGSAAVLPDTTGGVTVFWSERDGDSQRTVRRSTEPDGRLSRPENREAALRGTVPVGGDGARPWIVLRGNHGEPGVSRLRCPVIPVSPPAPAPATPARPSGP